MDDLADTHDGSNAASCPGPAALSFTGGKACLLALHRARAAGVRVSLLVSFVPALDDRLSPFLAHPLSVVAAQAHALQLPWLFIEVKGPDYEHSYRAALSVLRVEHGVRALVTGDVAESCVGAACPGFMERACRGSGVSLVRPLWGCQREKLADELLQAGFVAVVSCVNTSKLSPSLCSSLVGASFCPSWLQEGALASRLSEAGVSLFSLHGALHTWVLDGPGFACPVRLGPSVDVVTSTSSSGQTFSHLVCALSRAPKPCAGLHPVAPCASRPAGSHKLLRVASLLPSLTDVVCELGMADSLVGVTHCCDAAGAAGAAVVTSTHIDASASQKDIDAQVTASLRSGDSLYTLDAAALQRTAPTVVLTQSLCDVCAVAAPAVARVCGADASSSSRGGTLAPRVVSIEPRTLDDVWASFEAVAAECGVPRRGVALASASRAAVADIRAAVAAAAGGSPPPRVAFLEWTDPLFWGGHWVPGMVECAGGVCVAGPPSGSPSIRVSHTDVAASAPDVVIVAPCGFDTERSASAAMDLYSQPWFRDLPAAKRGRVFAINADLYAARPGPRLVDGVALLARVLHGVVTPRAPDEGDAWVRVMPPAEACRLEDGRRRDVM